MSDTDLLTARQAAELTGCYADSLHKAVRSGVLTPATENPRRFRLDDIQSWRASATQRMREGGDRGRATRSAMEQPTLSTRERVVPDTDLLTVPDAAALVGLTPKSVRHGIRTGSLPVADKGSRVAPIAPILVNRADLLEWHANARERMLEGCRKGGRLRGPALPGGARQTARTLPPASERVAKMAPEKKHLDIPITGGNAVLWDIWQMDRRASAEYARDVARHEREAGDRRESAAAAVREAA